MKKTVKKKRRIYTSALNRFGHKFGAVSERLDRALLVTTARDALTFKEIADQCDCNIARVKSHIQCLKFGHRNFGHKFAIKSTKTHAYMIASKSDLACYDETVIKRKVAVSNFETLTDE